jgi:hypothetical protein
MRRSKLIATLTAERGLVVVGPEALTLRRVRCGNGFGFRTEAGAVLTRPDVFNIDTIRNGQKCAKH